VQSQSLALDEMSPLEFTASDALASIAGNWERSLTWAKGGTTELTFAVTATGTTARWLDLEWVDEGVVGEDGVVAEGASPALCTDMLELPIAVQFDTVDGSFAESWTGFAFAQAATQAIHEHQFDVTKLDGSFEIVELDPMEFDTASGDVDATFANGALNGDISLRAFKTAEDGSRTSFAVPIATF
jgi:hypothetical protein